MKLTIALEAVQLVDIEVPECFVPDGPEIVKYLPEFLEHYEIPVPAGWEPSNMTFMDQGDGF